MTPGEAPPPWWLIIEPRPRWSPAIRVALRQAGRAHESNRVASHAELPALGEPQLIEQPLVVGLEVTHKNLGDALRSISSLRSSSAIAVVGLSEDEALDAALLEAGARLVIRGPRDSALLIRLADRHSHRCWERSSRHLGPVERVWRRLPWQSAPWRLG